MHFRLGLSFKFKVVNNVFFPFFKFKLTRLLLLQYKAVNATFLETSSVVNLLESVSLYVKETFLEISKLVNRL